jgi:hypothetical protein
LFALQFPIEQQLYIHLQELGIFQINFMEVLGFKKLDKNELLFEFLKYELCKFRTNYVESALMSYALN